MRCVVCDCCKKVIENARHCRVITCAKPLKLPIDNDKVAYRGNDRQQNDIIWEKEVCTDCQDALEAFFEQKTESTEPNEGETGTEPDDADSDNSEHVP